MIGVTLKRGANVEDKPQEFGILVECNSM